MRALEIVIKTDCDVNMVNEVLVKTEINTELIIKSESPPPIETTQFQC